MGDATTDRERWESRHQEMLEQSSLDPSTLLVEFGDLIREAPSGRALDVACGNGRNAFLLASLGYEVQAVDFSAPAIELVGKRAAELGVQVDAVITDLTEFDPGVERYAIVTHFMFLDRNLIPRLLRSLVPGGYLFFETFTVDESELLGHDMRRAYLLEHNEALRLFAPLRILFYRESIKPGNAVDDRPRATAELIGQAPGSVVVLPNMLNVPTVGRGSTATS